MYYLKRFFQIFLSLKKDKYTLKQRWVIAVFQVKFEMFLIKILICVINGLIYDICSKKSIIINNDLLLFNS